VTSIHVSWHLLSKGALVERDICDEEEDVERNKQNACSVCVCVCVCDRRNKQNTSSISQGNKHTASNQLPTKLSYQ
jgi:hypothetical protein